MNPSSSITQESSIDPEESSTLSPNMSKATLVSDFVRLPDFTLSGNFSGKGPAEQWFLRLRYDFRKVGHNPPPNELFLESAYMLFTGKALTWLRSTPHVWKIISQRDSATDEDLFEFETSAMEAFPFKIDDLIFSSPPREIKNLKQFESESIPNYYRRAMATLRRTNGRDSSKEGLYQLSCREEVFLRLFISYFVAGIRDEQILRAIYAREISSLRSMWKTLQVIQDCQRSLELIREFDRRDAEEKE